MTAMHRMCMGHMDAIQTGFVRVVVRNEPGADFVCKGMVVCVWRMRRLQVIVQAGVVLLEILLGVASIEGLRNMPVMMRMSILQVELMQTSLVRVVIAFTRLASGMSPGVIEDVRIHRQMLRSRENRMLGW